jgi:hypothetical protein
MPGSLRPDVDRVGAPTFGKERRRVGGQNSTPLPLGLVRPDRDCQARPSYSLAVNEVLPPRRAAAYLAYLGNGSSVASSSPRMRRAVIRGHHRPQCWLVPITALIKAGEP